MGKDSQAGQKVEFLFKEKTGQYISTIQYQENIVVNNITVPAKY